MKVIQGTRKQKVSPDHKHFVSGRCPSTLQCPPTHTAPARTHAQTRSASGRHTGASPHGLWPGRHRDKIHQEKVLGEAESAQMQPNVRALLWGT